MLKIDYGEKRDQFIISFVEVQIPTGTLDITLDVRSSRFCYQYLFDSISLSLLLEGGASALACTDTYSGPAAFSEKETKAMMDFYATIANKAEAFISFHCAAEVLLYPMGHTNSTELVPNVSDLVNFFKLF